MCDHKRFCPEYENCLVLLPGRQNFCLTQHLADRKLVDFGQILKGGRVVVVLDPAPAVHRHTATHTYTGGDGIKNPRNTTTADLRTRKLFTILWSCAGDPNRDFAFTFICQLTPCSNVWKTAEFKHVSKQECPSTKRSNGPDHPPFPFTCKARVSIFVLEERRQKTKKKNRSICTRTPHTKACLFSSFFVLRVWNALHSCNKGEKKKNVKGRRKRAREKKTSHFAAKSETLIFRSVDWRSVSTCLLHASEWHCSSCKARVHLPDWFHKKPSDDILSTFVRTSHFRLFCFSIRS